MRFTGAVIAEILVIGFSTAIWMFLGCFHLSSYFSAYDFGTAGELTSYMEKWLSPPIVLLTGIVMFYQLGVLMNHVCYMISKKWRSHVVLDEIYGKFETVRYQSGSEEFLKRLEVYVSFWRLGRAGVINFFLIAAFILPFGGLTGIIGGMMLALLGTVSYFLWREMTDLCYKKMNLFNQIMNFSDSSKTINEEIINIGLIAETSPDTDLSKMFSGPETLVEKRRSDPNAVVQ